jgi:hypothetical protein
VLVLRSAISVDHVVRLGANAEVTCACAARILHQQASGREDALRRSPACRMRDGLRAARRAVINRGWQHKPVVGRLLRRLGPRVP